MTFPRHACGLYLTHNGYKDTYESIDTAVKDLDEDDAWISPDERQQCLVTGDIWELQWYPRTPVGFCKVIGASLEAVLKAAAVA